MVNNVKKLTFLFLTLLSPLSMLSGCAAEPAVKDSEIEMIINEQYDFKYGRAHYAYDTYLLMDKSRERDTYYQVGPVVFKCPYDFKIIVKSIYTDASYYLRERYNDGTFNDSHLTYIASIHRQYMKHITGKTGLEFNAWYDKNNQRMEKSNFSEIDYSSIGTSYYGSYFIITLKHEETLKFKSYIRNEIEIENCTFGAQVPSFDLIDGHIIARYGNDVDGNNDYNAPYSKFNKNVPSDLRGRISVHLDKYADIDMAKKAASQIKSLNFVYDVSLRTTSQQGFII